MGYAWSAVSPPVSSVILTACGARPSKALWTAWVRQLVATGNVIYAGAYSTSTVPEGATPCVRVVFPLPNGNAMVLMRPIANPDGSLTLVSAGKTFGIPGDYFTVHTRDGAAWARYERTFRESSHVYALDGTVRADHVLTLWGLTFLRLHFRLRERGNARLG